MKKVFLCAAAVMMVLCGCSTPAERGVAYYARMSDELLKAKMISAAGSEKIKCAEADITVADADFVIDKEVFPGSIDELRIRTLGALAEIRRQALDPNSPEHVNALQTAADLRMNFSKSEQRVLWDIYIVGLAGKDHALMVLALNGDEKAVQKLDAYLASAASGAFDSIFVKEQDDLNISESERLNEVNVAIYAAGALENITPERRSSLTRIADTQRADLTGAKAVLSLARHHAVSTEKIAAELEYQRIHKASDEIISSYIVALGETGNAKDAITLGKYLENGSDAVAVSAAGAILKINRRLQKYRY